MEEVIAKVLELLAGAESQVMVIAIVLEFVFRLVPSKKPLSIAYAVASVARVIGEVLVKFASILDKVLPQKVKEE